MLEKYIFLAIIIGTLLYWFRSNLKDLKFSFILIGFYCLFSGILVGSIILFVLNYFNISGNPIYGALIGPFLEELGKFVAVILIIQSMSQEIDKSSKPQILGLTVGVLIGLGFGIYENIIYFKGWNVDIVTLLIRSVLVGGIMLHPLTSGIYGYILGSVKGGCLSHFKTLYQKFDSFQEINKFVSQKIDSSIMKLFHMIKNILILDLTINNIFGNKNLEKGKYSVIELVLESFFLGFWLHSIYNTLLVYASFSQTPVYGHTLIFLQITGILISILLSNLFVNLYGSKIFGYLTSLVFISAFLAQDGLATKLGTISMIFLIASLILISLRLDQKLNPRFSLK